MKMCGWQFTVMILWLPDEDGLSHIDSLRKSEIHSERRGNIWIRRFGCEILLIRVFRVGTDRTGQFFGH